jgi:beta-lactam-binding protein with PASTA domain
VISQNQVIFDFTSRAPDNKDRAGTVASQMPAANAVVNAGSRAQAVIAMPVTPTDGKVYGIFSEKLPSYPYPFQVKLEAVTPSGDRKLLVSMKHPGGSFTVPYAVEDGTVLVLTILNKEVSTLEVHANSGDEAAKASE